MRRTGWLILAFLSACHPVVSIGSADGGSSCFDGTCAGCCAGETCVPLAVQSDSACGSSAYACIACGAGTLCEMGACVTNTCSPNTCSGCCLGNTCLGGSDQTSGACGGQGDVCVACGAGAFCDAGGCWSPRLDAGWTMLAFNGPPARSGHAVAYDAQRQRTVMFGGFGASLFQDTWEWDGAGWNEMADGGPPARNYPGMTYDSARARTVLFGGLAGTYFGDTWEWDGSSWSLVSLNGPSARRSPLAYDANQGVTLMFGGDDVSGHPQQDTWAWNGSAWNLVASTGPSARIGHALAYDSARGRVVLFGGSANGLLLQDTWEWNGSSWILAATGGPSPRFTQMAYDAVQRRVVLYGGGVGSGAAQDTWTWDGLSWTLSSATNSGIGQRLDHAMAYDVARGTVVLFGGRTFLSTGDGGIYLADGDTWGF